MLWGQSETGGTGLKTASPEPGAKQSGKGTIVQEDTAEVTAVSSYFVKNVLESGG